MECWCFLESSDFSIFFFLTIVSVGICLLMVWWGDELERIWKEAFVSQSRYYGSIWLRLRLRETTDNLRTVDVLAMSRTEHLLGTSPPSVQVDIALYCILGITELSLRSFYAVGILCMRSQIYLSLYPPDFKL